jgi:hypothetical protein
MSRVQSVPNPLVRNHAGNSPTDQIVQGVLSNLESLVGSISRYTGNQQTIYDNGGPRAGSSAGANAMEQRVVRAWTQVLGRAPGRGADNFLQALNGAFPELPGGGVATLPARTVVSLSGPDANGSLDSTPGYAGGGLSARQTALYRQSSIIVADAQKVLSGLKPFIPDADPERVEAVRSLIGQILSALVQEFGRIDEPREPTVENYLLALNGANNLNGPDGAIVQFGKAAGYLAQAQQVLGQQMQGQQPPGPQAPNQQPANLDFVVIPPDEGQLAGFRLVRDYVATITNVWRTYKRRDPSNPSELSLRIDRATIMLGTVNEANEDFRQALLSVGLGEAEQRASTARFNQLNPRWQRVTMLQDITPIDLTDWIQGFHTQGLSILSESGRYGLDFTADQADAIFWVIAPVLHYVQTQPQVGVRPVLLQTLQNERVLWGMSNLLTQLDGLADLHSRISLS